ncbi:MAG: hypothetical protein GAK39_01442 [Variovorax sp.]|nr:MAG: hypothetical protein GAK39_01442 [Variovorax sp.]
MEGIVARAGHGLEAARGQQALYGSSGGRATSPVELAVQEQHWMVAQRVERAPRHRVAVREPAAVREVVRHHLVAIDRALQRIALRLGRGAGLSALRVLPDQPGERRARLQCEVVVREHAAQRGQQRRALGQRDRVGQPRPCFGIARARPLEAPMQLRGIRHEQPAQQQPVDGLRMAHRIGQRQRRAPRTADHQPALDAQVPPQRLDVGDQQLGAVVARFAARRAASRAALVEGNHAIARRIEAARERGRTARARPAMQHERGATLDGTGGLPMQ